MGKGKALQTLRRWGPEWAQIRVVDLCRPSFGSDEDASGRSPAKIQGKEWYLDHHANPVSFAATAEKWLQTARGRVQLQRGDDAVGPALLVLFGPALVDLTGVEREKMSAGLVEMFMVLKELTGTRASPPKRAQPLASILSTQWASFGSDPQKVILPEQVLAASFHLFQLFPMGASRKLTQPGTTHSPAVV